MPKLMQITQAGRFGPSVEKVAEGWLPAMRVQPLPCGACRKLSVLAAHDFFLRGQIHKKLGQPQPELNLVSEVKINFPARPRMR